MQPPLNISDQQKLIEEVLRQRSFGRFSDKLASVITDLWLRAGDDVLMAITELLRGTGKFTAADFDRIDDVARQSLSTAFGGNISPLVREASVVAYGRGLNEIRTGLAKSFTLVDREAVEFLHEHHMYWSLNHYDSHVTNRLKRLSDTVIKSGMSRADAGKFFERTIGRELKRDSAYWELTADAITTRARSFSNISAFEQAGIDRYIVSIVDDHRTSDICRYLGGKEVKVKNDLGEEETVQLKEHERRFDVVDAAKIRDKMLKAETPEEAKEIMPWRSPKTVLSKFPKDLARSGVMMPPFHGNCRSRLVIA